MIFDIKKNQKKILAIFSVGLMIAFALPSAVSNYQKNRVETVGMLGQEKVTSKDVGQAKAEWDNLKYVRFARHDPRNPSAEPEAVPITDILGGPEKAREIENKPELYFLLQREADRMGVTVPQDVVQEWLHNRIVTSNDNISNTELAPLVENFLKVREAGIRAAAGLQASRPQVLDELSKHQSFSLNVVEFKAQDYLSKVPPYSDAERQKKLDEIYAQYKAELPTTRPANPKTGEPQDDFAFGYRVPNQVQVQYIEVPRDAVVRLVKTKITEVDAIKYYMEHPELYPTTRPAEDVTFKSSPPPPGSVAAMTSSSQPATQAVVPKIFTESVVVTQMTHVNAPPMSFKDYKQKVYDDVTIDRARAMTNDILSDITSTMAADYAEFKKTPAAQHLTSTATSMPATAPAVPANSSVGVPYTSYAYLQKLALHEQDKFQLLPTIGYDAGLRSEQQLDASPLGQAVLPEYGPILRAVFDQTHDFNQAQSAGAIAKFPRYATNLIEPLVTPQAQQLARAFRLRTLALFEPSAAMQSGSYAAQPQPTGGTFVFRAIQAVPAHPAPQADVKEQLLTDARLRDAYDLARKDAEKLSAEAQKTKLGSAAAAAGKPVISTGMLDLGTPPDLAALKITDNATQTVFLNAAYDLLKTGEKGIDRQHPIGVIDLKPATTVFVGQVNELKPIWTPDTLTAYERLVKVQQDQGTIAANQTTWLNADDIMQRMQYKDLSSKKSQQPSPAPEQQQLPDQNVFR